MAQVARTAFRRQRNELGTFCKAVTSLSASQGENMPFRSIAKPSFEEPYASITLVRVCGGFG